MARNGRMMASLTLEDLEGSIEATVFPQVLEKYRDVLHIDAIVRIRAKVERADREPKLVVLEVQPLADEGSFERLPGTLRVRASVDLLSNGGGTQFKSILTRYPGRDAVEVELVNGSTVKYLRMGDEYRVDCSAPGLHAELKELLGDGAVWEV
jgi:DNA polymerase-3 subunit alpha